MWRPHIRHRPKDITLADLVSLTAMVAMLVNFYRQFAPDVKLSRWDRIRMQIRRCLWRWRNRIPIDFY